MYVCVACQPFAVPTATSWTRRGRRGHKPPDSQSSALSADFALSLLTHNPQQHLTLQRIAMPTKVTHTHTFNHLRSGRSCVTSYKMFHPFIFCVCVFLENVLSSPRPRSSIGVTWSKVHSFSRDHTGSIAHTAALIHTRAHTAEHRHTLE